MLTSAQRARSRCYIEGRKYWYVLRQRASQKVSRRVSQARGVKTEMANGRRWRESMKELKNRGVAKTLVRKAVRLC